MGNGPCLRRTGPIGDGAAVFGAAVNPPLAAPPYRCVPVLSIPCRMWVLSIPCMLVVKFLTKLNHSTGESGRKAVEQVFKKIRGTR
jgi:hypothetical protein